MNRLTHAEATELLETAFNVTGDDMGNTVSATLLDMDETRAWADVESYLAMIPREIDPSSIQIRGDMVDETIDAVTITIFTGEA